MSHVGAGGAWKAWVGGSGGTGTAVGVSGAWKSIEGAWVGSGGSWKQFFTAATFPLDGGTRSISSTTNDPGTATAGFRLKSNGTAEFRQETPSSAPGYQSNPQDWIDPAGTGVGSDYQVRLTATSGSVDSGTTGSWLALSSDRTWEVADNTVFGQQFEGTLEIRRASDSTVVSTSTLNLSAQTQI